MYTDLNDPKTGAKRDAAKLARDFVLSHNETNDAQVLGVLNAVGKKDSATATLEALYRRHRDYIQQGKTTEATATSDAMAITYYQAIIERDQNAGAERIGSYTLDTLRRGGIDAGRTGYQKSERNEQAAARQQASAQLAAKEQARLAKRTSNEEAVEAVLGLHTGADYNSVLSLLNTVTKEGAAESPRTALLNRKEHVGGMGIMGESWRISKAISALDKREEILANVDTSTGGALSIAASATALPTAPAAPAKGKLDTSGSAFDAAWAEAFPLNKPNRLGLTAAEVVSAKKLYADNKGNLEGEYFAVAFKALNEHGGKDHAAAAFLISRAHDIEMDKRKGHTTDSHAGDLAAYADKRRGEWTKWFADHPNYGTGADAAASEQAGPAAGGASERRRVGVRMYGRKDGSKPPLEEEALNLQSDEEVRALQRSLGFTGVEVDGHYGPKTHAAAKEKAEAAGKKLNELDVSAGDKFTEFLSWLTAPAAPEAAPAAAAPAAPVAVPDDIKKLLEQSVAALGAKDDALFAGGKQSILHDGVIDDADKAVIKKGLVAFKDDFSTLKTKGTIVSPELQTQVEGLLSKLAAGGVSEADAVVGQSIKDLRAATLEITPK